MGIDDVFAVIAEETRRQILERLRDGDRAVGELVIELQVSQPTVSKHLKVLREAGLVTMRAQGQKRYYALRAEPLGQVRSWLAGFEASSDDQRAGAGVVPSVPEGIAVSEGTADAECGTDGAAARPEVPAAALAAAPVADTVTGAPGNGVCEPAPDVLAAAVVAGTAALSASESVSVVAAGPDALGPAGRTRGRRAADRAADLLAQLRRRRGTSS